MNWWLKMVGTSAEPIEDGWRDQRDWMRRFMTSRKRMRMRPGDGIAYYATGLGSVFAFGVVKSFVYEKPEADYEDYRWRVDVTLGGFREFVHEGVPLEVVSVDGRDLRGSIKQQSHITLRPPEFDAIVKALST